MVTTAGESPTGSGRVGFAPGVTGNPSATVVAVETLANAVSGLFAIQLRVPTASAAGVLTVDGGSYTYVTIAVSGQ